MPELPDVEHYVEALAARTVGHTLREVRLSSPFVLRTVDPPLDAARGATVRRVFRVGKRIVLELEPEVFLVIHLMIAGRLRWRPSEPPPKPAAPPPRRLTLAVFDFDSGQLYFTEAGSKKRASLMVMASRAGVTAIDPGGIEPLDASLDELRSALSRTRHTLKRALTDPHLISGIGNAYSDEILHAARLSPLELTDALTEAEWQRLHQATHTTLRAWLDRLRTEAAGAFPEKVTAFHEGMAVHGRFNQPCPVCAAPVQRIVYTNNECNYCARCQTGGRRLADRAMSRLLKDAWPRTLDEV
jgi:formamidopyrimidine-DNA glycosylase